MREILFRAKRNDNYEWIVGCLINAYAVPNYYAFITTNILDKPKKVLRKTVGQYIGLIDKSGKCIFEGDIVRDISTYLVHLQYAERGVETKEEAEKYRESGAVAVVRYDSSGEVGSCGCCYEHFVGTGFIATEVDLTQCEVIGNIHDNPELLEVTNER